MNDMNITGLLIDLEVRQTQLERGFAKANKTQRRVSEQMERRAKQSADRMGAAYSGLGDKIGAAFKKLNAIPMPGIGVGLAGLAGAGVGAGLVTMTRQIAGTVREVANLGSEARRAGMAVEDFQRWGAVMRQNRIETDAFVDATKELNLRADEFIQTGVGGGADMFKRLGFTADDLAKRLKNPSDLMLEISKRMQSLDTAARLRVSDELFGGQGGERLAEVFGRGNAEIERILSSTSVLTAKQVEEADQLDRRYTALGDSLHRVWQRAALGATDFALQVANAKQDADNLAASDLFRNPDQAPQILGAGVSGALENNGQAVADNAAAIGDLLSMYERFASETDSMAPILQRFGGELDRIGNTQAGQTLQGVSLSMQTLSQQLDTGEISARDFETQMGDLIAKARDALAGLNEIDGDPRFDRVIERLGGLREALEGLRRTAAQARDALPGGSLPTTTGTPLTVDTISLPGTAQAPTSSPRPTAAPPMTHELASAPKAAAKGERDQFADAVQRLNEEKQALDAQAAAYVAAAASGERYTTAIERARIQSELLVAAQRQGKQITPDLKAHIDALTESYIKSGNAAEQAADKAKKATDQNAKGAEALSSVFTGVLTGATSAQEAVAGLLSRIGTAMMDRAFMSLFTTPGTGASGFASFIGGMLSGFATGGYTGDGGKFEPAGIVHKGEYVFSAETVKRLGANNLDRIHQSARKGYASGGLVGHTGKIAKAASVHSGDSGSAPAPVVTISAPITVNANGGTPAQNADLANQMAAQTERMFRSMVHEELINQMRPGGMLR